MNLFKILRSLKLILSVFNQIYEAIEKEGLQFSKLNTIIFTHQDIDHIGNVCDILKKVPEGIKTFSHEEEKVYINGERTPVKIDETLVDGQELPYCGGIIVIHTPGHTTGHICLYFKQWKTLIAGDIFCINDGILCRENQNLNFDNELNIKSIQKLMKYDVEKVICYHGGIYNENVNIKICI